VLLSNIKDVQNGRLITKDANVTININIGESDAVKINRVAEPLPEDTPSSGNTEGTVYKGYTIQQDEEGKFSVFSVGGVPVATMMNSLAEAMNKVDGISVEEVE
jgi:hypothetical protein